MTMFPLADQDARRLLLPGDDERARDLLQAIGFEDLAPALARWRRLCLTEADQAHLLRCLPSVLQALREAPAPDVSLRHFERLADAASDRSALLAQLAEHPRTVEILFRLFVNSQFLTEILLRDQLDLAQITHRQRLAEIKSPPQFLAEAEAAAKTVTAVPAALDALRRFQQREILRLAACDSFHLMDLQTVTQQLARLAESLVQTCLTLVARELRIDASGFAVLAFGKLGGEELNYSSDIDLVFVTRQGAERFWGLGQKLIRALSQTTAAGFLYRVDMRLRPWGQSGPLVTTIDAYLDYLRQHGRSWERQALLKARPIAGAIDVGWDLLRAAEPLVFAVDAEEARTSILATKRTIEQSRGTAGAPEAAVKTGPGGIRDIEFLTQYLQLIHGQENPQVRSANTLDGLIRLADFNLILPGEYRHLTSAYVFQRTVEHALQLLHNKQRHSLPESRRELAYLARRLDFPDVETFLEHYAAHRRFARDIFERRLQHGADPETQPSSEPADVARHLGPAASTYAELFSHDQTARHLRLLERLGDACEVCVEARPREDGTWELTIVGYDQFGDLSLMSGLLFAYDFDIAAGSVFTGSEIAQRDRRGAARGSELRRKFVNVFLVRPRASRLADDVWERYQADLRELIGLAASGRIRDAQGILARRVGKAVRKSRSKGARLLPVEIAIENDVDPDATVMHIRSEDTPGFLYELSNALAMSGVSIQRVLIHTTGAAVVDTLYVTTAEGLKITAAERLHELRAAIVLTKHFTHLLQRSPNPESALLHFRGLLEQLFREDRWIEQLASLQQPDVLEALARLLGGSDFLWEDFLRLQHTNLFPLVTDVAGLREVRDLPNLRKQLVRELERCDGPAAQRQVLNEFKDREMFRIDMRHILNLQKRFGLFSQELTWLAEAVVEAAVDICEAELVSRYGRPEIEPGRPCRLSVCALGKCGGQELGFASDIELMFLYEADGLTSGPERISNQEYFVRLVENFRRTIRAKQQGIFEVDLRLRPYGQAGSLAVAKDAFERYFDPDGPAWPYERQALVKLRPVAGDQALGAEVVAARDRIVYSGRPFDLAAMRGMRERQVRELVRAGEFNAKLSPGGLVDCEYFVQALQIHFGASQPALRDPNTRGALRSLEAAGILADRKPLRDAYRFLRRLIDALRMVRGDARDLTVPPPESEQFEFLARRLGYEQRVRQLQTDIDRHTTVVLAHQKLLERLLTPPDALARSPAPADA